jgi:hypothetical protein
MKSMRSWILPCIMIVLSIIITSCAGARYGGGKQSIDLIYHEHAKVKIYLIPLIDFEMLERKDKLDPEHLKPYFKGLSPQSVLPETDFRYVLLWDCGDGDLSRHRLLEKIYPETMFEIRCYD